MKQHNQYTSEYQTVADIQSKETHNLAVLYGSSTTNEWKAFALQTNMTIRRIERAFSIETLGDGDTLDYGMLQSDGHEKSADTEVDPSKDILRVGDAEDETLVEWTLGVSPGEDELYVGVQNPKTEIVSGLQGDRLRRESGVDDLDQHGVRADLTTTEEGGLPTTALSETPGQGLIRIDSDEEGRNPIRIGFHNATGSQVTVDVEAVGVAYHVTPITDSGVVEDMVFGNGHNRRVISWGNFENTSPNMPRDWSNGVITLDDEDVTSIIGNGA